MAFNALEMFAANEAGKQRRYYEDQTAAFKQAGNALAMETPDYNAAASPLLKSGNLEAGMKLRGLGRDQQQAQATAAQDQQKQGIKTALSFAQNAMQVPEAQRTQWAAQNWGQLAGAFPGKTLEMVLAEDPNAFSDMGLQQDIYAAQAALGVAPKSPDYGFTNVDGNLIRTDKTGGGIQSMYQAPQERQTMRDVNGVERYVDTGEPVFEGVTKAAPQMTPYQRAQLGIQQERLGLDREKMMQQQVTASQASAPRTAGPAPASPFDSLPFYDDDGQVIEASFGDGGISQSSQGSGPNRDVPTHLKSKATKFDQKYDEVMAKMLSEWQTGGQSSAYAELSKLDAIIKELEGGGNRTGKIVGSYVNGPLGPYIAPKSTDLKERTESVIQKSLRSILGSSYTEQEGMDTIRRAYNSRLDESMNAERLRNEYNQLLIKSQLNDAAAGYAARHGTMQGFNGRIPAIQAFEASIAKQAAPASGQAAPDVSSMSNDDLLSILNQ